MYKYNVIQQTTCISVTQRTHLRKIIQQNVSQVTFKWCSIHYSASYKNMLCYKSIYTTAKYWLTTFYNWLVTHNKSSRYGITTYKNNTNDALRQQNLFDVHIMINRWRRSSSEQPETSTNKPPIQSKASNAHPQGHSWPGQSRGQDPQNDLWDV